MSAHSAANVYTWQLFRGYAMEKERRVFLVPSGDLGWIALRSALRSSAQIEYLGEASSTQRAVALIQMLHPDVVIAARSIDDEPVTSLLREIAYLELPTSDETLATLGMHVVVCAHRFPPAELPELAALGVASYLLWDDFTPDLLETLINTAVLPRFTVLSRRVAEIFALIRVSGFASASEAVELDSREQFILDALAGGKGEKEIANELRVSLRVIQRHIQRLKTKYDAPNLYVLGMRAGSCHYDLLSREAKLMPWNKDERLA